MSIPFAWIVSLTIFAIAILLSPHFPICSDVIGLSALHSGKYFHPLDYLKMLKRLRDRVCLFFRQTFPQLFQFLCRIRRTIHCQSQRPFHFCNISFMIRPLPSSVNSGFAKYIIILLFSRLDLRNYRSAFLKKPQFTPEKNTFSELPQHKTYRPQPFP